MTLLVLNVEVEVVIGFRLDEFALVVGEVLTVLDFKVTLVLVVVLLVELLEVVVLDFVTLVLAVEL